MNAVDNTEIQDWTLVEVDSGFNIMAGDEYICNVGGDRTFDEAKILATTIIEGVNAARKKIAAVPPRYEFTPTPWQYREGQGIWKAWGVTDIHNWNSHKLADVYCHDIIDEAQAEGNSRRIVVAVNLMGAIPTAMLERAYDNVETRMNCLKAIAAWVVSESK